MQESLIYLVRFIAGVAQVLGALFGLFYFSFFCIGLMFSASATGQMFFAAFLSTVISFLGGAIRYKLK